MENRKGATSERQHWKLLIPLTLQTVVFNLRRAVLESSSPGAP